MKFCLTTALLLCCIFQTLRAEDLDSTRVYPIQEVSVQAYRTNVPLRDVPNKVEVITARDLQSVPAWNLADAVKKNVNADAVDMQGLTGGIDFRGYAPSAAGTNAYTRLLVDGLPLSTRNTSATALGNITSVEVLKGPFSSMYGSGAMGGVVNFVTPQSRGAVHGSGAIGYGSFNTLTLDAALGGNIAPKLDFDFYFGLYNQNKDYKTGGHDLFCMTAYDRAVMDPHSYSVRYPNTRYDKKSGGLRLGYDLSRKWRINLYNDIYYTGHGRANGMLWGMYEQTDKKVVRNAHRLDLTGTEGRHTMRYAAYYSSERSSYDNDFGYMVTRSRSDYQTWGVQAQDAVKLGAQTLVFGVDNFSQRYLSRQWTSEGDRDAPFQPDYLNMQNGIFIQGNLSFWNARLTAVAGARYDWTLLKTYATPYLDMKPDDRSYGAFNPNVAVKYKVFRGFSVRGSAGTAYLVPDAFKMTGEYTVWGTRYKGNPGLKAEKSFNYDFGAEFRDRREALLLDVTLFGTNHRNMITSDYSHSSEGYVTYVNADRAEVRGLEYLLSADFGRLFDKRYMLRLYASYTHIYKAEVEMSSGVSIPKKYISRDLLNFGLDFSAGRFSARINGRYTGPKLEDNWIYVTDYQTYERKPFVTAGGVEVRPSLIGDNEVTLPRFMVFDLWAGYTVTKFMSVGVKLNNLLDENYMERDGYYMPGRNFTVQVSFRF